MCEMCVALRANVAGKFYQKYTSGTDIIKIEHTQMNIHTVMLICNTDHYILCVYCLLHSIESRALIEFLSFVCSFVVLYFQPQSETYCTDIVVVG